MLTFRQHQQVPKNALLIKLTIMLNSVHSDPLQALLGHARK